MHSACLRETAQRAARQKLRLNKAGALLTPDKTCANSLYRLNFRRKKVRLTKELARHAASNISNAICPATRLPKLL